MASDPTDRAPFTVNDASTVLAGVMNRSYRSGYRQALADVATQLKPADATPEQVRTWVETTREKLSDA